MSDQIATQVVHAGEERSKPYNALITPIVQTSTYAFANTAEVLTYVERKTAGNPKLREEYGRYGNPTQAVAERKLAELDGGERALLFSSGMSAITTALLAHLSAGQHLILVEGCYRRTQDFAAQFLSRWNIETTFVPMNDFAALEAAIRPTTRMIFTETPTNPYLRVMDLERLTEIARPRGILTAIDSTFATPLGLRPLDFGLDLVIHSATKYLAGHNDILSGAVIGPAALLKPIEDARGVLGCVSGAQDAYLLLRGIKTLALRFRQQCENALHLAHYLANHPAVANVYYPGLPCHPDYEIAQRQLRCFGGVVSFELEGDKERTSRFIDRLQIPFIGPTLGGVESIVQQQALFISSDPVERRKVGISDTLVRYAVGIEDAADLISDLEQALA